MSTYAEFLEKKSQFGDPSGFDPVFMPEFLFPFQQSLVEWSIRMGRSATFADCGLGKTPMQLVFAENVVRKTNKPVLLLTPIAVGAQTVREGEKFGIECSRSIDGNHGSGIVVANYERLHYFDPSSFSGVICDESSILKSFDGQRKQAITDFMRKVPYRSLYTATAAPNDFFELGTSSEAIGHLGYMDMLHRFFKNDQGKGSAASRSYGQQVQWRLKVHAEESFWRWVCSWARAIRKPSDFGFDDGAFTLPPLIQTEHIVSANTSRSDTLFDVPAITMDEQREEQRRTIQERCERVADLVNHNEPALVWCQLNDESALLRKLIPDCVEVSGSDSDESKESKLLDFQSGRARVLVTKPKIGAWGLNFQHCAHVTFFPSHSFEQFYQGVRRCWRFGQDKPVRVDVVCTEGGRGVLDSLDRKAKQTEVMFDNLVRLMNDAMHIDRGAQFPKPVEVPKWL